MYERDVRRVLVRILGTSPDVADALQDTFVRALRNVTQVKEALALRSWLLRVAVTVAFDQLRRRQRLRWLVFSNDASVDVAADSASPELRAALRDTYGVLDRLPAEERVAFALRHIQEMELEEIADACSVSLSTIKRRLAKAELRFKTIARRQPGLADWIDEEAFR
jgi:RNA polymerase sigma-70 factor (ECF subfamily)